MQYLTFTRLPKEHKGRFRAEVEDPFGSKTIVENGIEVVIPNQCVLSCGCFGNAIPLTHNQS